MENNLTWIISNWRISITEETVGWKVNIREIKTAWEYSQVSTSRESAVVFALNCIEKIESNIFMLKYQFVVNTGNSLPLIYDDMEVSPTMDVWHCLEKIDIVREDDINMYQAFTSDNRLMKSYYPIQLYANHQPFRVVRIKRKLYETI